MTARPTENFDTVFESELALIADGRVQRGVDPDPLQRAKSPSVENGLTGLAISGGGIRSATLALGVLQALAHNDQLRRFDYLSTVSGGGYIGSALSWLLSRKPRGEFDPGLGRADFPYGTDAPGRPKSDKCWQRHLLGFLREHGNYLTPGNGLTLLSGAGVVLRAVLLNLIVWFPLLVAVLVALVWLDVWGGAIATPFVWPHPVCCTGELACDPATSQCALEASWSPERWPLDSWLPVAITLVGVFVGFAIVYSLYTGIGRPLRREASAAHESRYAWRRRLEKWTGRLVGATSAVAVIASLPWAARSASEAILVAGSAGAVALGIGSGLLSFFRAGRSSGLLPTSAIATIGAALLLYGLAFLGYWTALNYFVDDPAAFRIGLTAATLIALFSGFVVNLNHIGLHRFYRDRLMETFLPPVEEVLASRGKYTGPSPEADSFALSSLADSKPRGPYHLVNTHVVLVDSPTRRYRMRGGDSFVLSPLYCGSEATGWLETKKFVRDGMTLPTAMAISGAAAQPNTGVGGVGLTRSKAVSLMMALLNIRLGYWVRNPRFSQRFKLPSHFTSALYEIGPWFYRESSRYLQLSDGGHFENLALYELVRRRARTIVVCDGGEDGEYRFGDLQNAIRRILADFGARIAFEGTEKLQQLIPWKRDDRSYPADAAFAERGFLVGTIVYPPLGEGTREEIGNLVFLKSTMIADVGLRAKGYKAREPAFPHQSTADQFFDEDQFEAYRDLGYRIGMQARIAIDDALS